jgi:hypothetical protein
METEFAVIADRDDAAGDGAVLLGICRETFSAVRELVVAFLKLLRFRHQREIVDRAVLSLKECGSPFDTGTNSFQREIVDRAVLGLKDAGVPSFLIKASNNRLG